MAQRLGAVLAVAVATTVFAGNGALTGPEAVTSGFRPALWACSAFAGLGAVAATGLGAQRAGAPAAPGSEELPAAA